MGNVPYWAVPESEDKYTGLGVISFPTKHHWRAKSDLKLIENSAEKLLNFAKIGLVWKHIWLPVVGCGLGGLDWDTQVKPLLSSILDDRFTVVFRGTAR